MQQCLPSYLTIFFLLDYFKREGRLQSNGQESPAFKKNRESILRSVLRQDNQAFLFLLAGKLLTGFSGNDKTLTFPSSGCSNSEHGKNTRSRFLYGILWSALEKTLDFCRSLSFVFIPQMSGRLNRCLIWCLREISGGIHCNSVLLPSRGDSARMAVASAREQWPLQHCSRP